MRAARLSVQPSTAVVLASVRLRVQKSMSVVEVTNMERYDANGKPVPGGLYDAALGFCDFGMKCKTCGNEYSGTKKANDCPGHFGHIQVCVSVVDRVGDSGVGVVCGRQGCCASAVRPRAVV
jgi:hypothetical protein